MGKSNLTFAYYRDGTVSAGTTNDLDSKRAPRKYSLAKGFRPQDLLGVAIDRLNHHVYAFYHDEKPLSAVVFRPLPGVCPVGKPAKPETP